MNVVPRNGATYTKRRIMFEFTIGTRFYYKGKLCEVVEPQSERCRECAVSYGFDECMMLDCRPSCRQDGKNVCFKWVEE